VSSENTNLIKILKDLNKDEIQRSFIIWDLVRNFLTLI
jgi:hypothetical protein